MISSKKIFSLVKFSLLGWISGDKENLPTWLEPDISYTSQARGMLFAQQHTGACVLTKYQFEMAQGSTMFEQECPNKMRDWHIDLIRCYMPPSISLTTTPLKHGNTDCDATAHNQNWFLFIWCRLPVLYVLATKDSCRSRRQCWALIYKMDWWQMPWG